MGKSQNFLYRFSKKLSLLILASVVAACGSTGSDSPEVPPNASIEIVTGDREWEINQALDSDGNPVCLGLYQDEPVVVLVADSQGRALGNVDLTFSLTLSGNTLSVPPIVSLYDDMNGNGVADHPEELVSGENDPLFTTQTDERDGSAFAIVRLDLSCVYASTLTVFGAGMAASVDFTVEDNE